MADPLSWITPQLRELESQHLLRGRREVALLPGGWCLSGGRRLRNFAGNDYLGLALDDRLRQAAERAVRESGSGAGASPVVAGRTPWLAALEAGITRFEECAGAIVFPTGYAANLGTIASLAGAGDVLFCDRANHASLVDGCRLSGGRLQVYRHTALERLEQGLARSTGYRRRFIITDSVFSMDGDLAPLRDLVEIADRHEAILIVDEAHGTGVWGAGGRGACEALGVADRVPVRIGTLSKSVGALGGFVAGDRPLIDWLWNRGRTQIYSTALPPAVCAAAAVGLEIIAEEPERRTRLWQNCATLRGQLQSRGIVPPTAAEGPIVPLVLQDADQAMKIAAALEERGFLVGAIRPPTVPRGTSRLRITVSAVHDHDALVQFAEALAAVWPRKFHQPAPSSTD